MEGLILGAQREQDRMLKVGREDDALVASLTRQLHTQIPWHESYEGERWLSGQIGVLGKEAVLILRKSLERNDGVLERASSADMLPGQSCERSAERSDRSVDWFDQHALTMELLESRVSVPLGRECLQCATGERDPLHIDDTSIQLTSGRLGSRASTTTQPISITSALSLVT